MLNRDVRDLMQISTTSVIGNVTESSTNAALKGIIAIKAMSQISALLHKSDDSQNYSVGWIQ